MAIGSPTEAAIKFLIGADLSALHEDIAGLHDVHQRVLDFQHALQQKSLSIAQSAAAGIHQVSDAVHGRVATVHAHIHEFHESLSSGIGRTETAFVSLLYRAEGSLKHLVHHGDEMGQKLDHMTHGAHSFSGGLDDAAESARNLNKHLGEGKASIAETLSHAKELIAGLKEGFLGGVAMESAREYLERAERITELNRVLPISEEQRRDFFRSASEQARHMPVAADAYIRSPQELADSQIYGVQQGIGADRKSREAFSGTVAESAWHLGQKDADVMARYIALHHASFSPEDIRLSLVEDIEGLVQATRARNFQTPLTVTHAWETQQALIPWVEKLPEAQRPKAMREMMAGVAGFESAHVDQQGALQLMEAVRQSFRTEQGRAILGGLEMLGVTGETRSRIQALAEKGEYAEASQTLLDSLRTYEASAPPGARMQMQQVLGDAHILSLDQIMRLGESAPVDITGAARLAGGHKEFTNIEVEFPERLRRMGNQTKGLWFDLGTGFGESIGKPLTLAMTHTQGLIDLFYKIPESLRAIGETLFGLAGIVYGGKGLLKTFKAGKALWAGLGGKGGKEAAEKILEVVGKGKGVAGIGEAGAEVALSAEEIAQITYSGAEAGKVFKLAQAAKVAAEAHKFVEAGLSADEIAQLTYSGGTAAAGAAEIGAAVPTVVEGAGVVSKGLGASGVGAIVSAVIELGLWTNRFREAGGFHDIAEGWKKVNETGEGTVDLYRRLNDKVYETSGLLKYLPGFAAQHAITKALLPDKKAATEWEQIIRGVSVVARSTWNDFARWFEGRMSQAWSFVALEAGTAWVKVKDKGLLAVEALKLAWASFSEWLKHTWAGEALGWFDKKADFARQWWGDVLHDPLKGARDSLGNLRKVGAADMALQEGLRHPQAAGATLSRPTPTSPVGAGEFARVLPFPQAQAHPGIRAGNEGTYADLIASAAKHQGVDPNLLREVMRRESQFDPGAVSKAGAMGLMQVMPDTAAGLGVKDPKTHLLDPTTNVEAGAKYLHQLLAEFHGDEKLALAAYNAGSSAVHKHGDQIPPFRETQEYVRSIEAHLAATRDTGMDQARQQVAQVQQAGVERRIDTTNEVLVQIRDYLARQDKPPLPGLSPAGRALVTGHS